MKFKENIQALLKLKELLIPQADGNFVKNWEEEANKYQTTSENILLDLKNTNYIEGFVNAIYDQLVFLRNNLSNYSVMEDIQKDKFKRLYVLAALGFIAKLKLIFFFTTYLNSRDDKKVGSFLHALQDNMNGQLSGFSSEYDNKMINDLINHEDTSNNNNYKDSTGEETSNKALIDEGYVYSNLINEIPQNYSPDFYNMNDQFKENMFNMMLNNLVNIESQNSGKNEIPIDAFNVNFPMFFNNINQVNNVRQMNYLYASKQNSSNLNNTNYEDIETLNNPLPMNTDHISKDNSFANSLISASKESGNISSKNKNAYIIKNAQTMNQNQTELFPNEQILNYRESYDNNNNTYIKNECNQDSMEKYLTDGFTNFDRHQNLGRFNSNQINTTNYLQYQLQHNNTQLNNIHLNYNKINSENYDAYGNKYY